MFDVDLLRSFVAVAESGGFTRAAARLNSTQSTVSAQIQRLEAGAGHALFVRSTRSVRLTPPGEILLGYARTILRLNEEVQLRLSGNAGRLRVGAAEDFAGWLLPAILRSFGHQYPDVQIEVEIGMGASLFAMIETGTLDVAIAGVCEENVGGFRLWKEPLTWAFAAGVDLPDPLPLALFPEPCPYREAALRALAPTQRPWRIACTGASVASVRALAVAGVATTPLPRHALRDGLQALGNGAGLPNLCDLEYVLQTREGDTRPIVTAFTELCRLTFSEGTGTSALGSE
jgi:DNA-binding transcriptional LysR family regulator